ncbi:hypothetical protein D3C71_762690 [compost metagenome]|jgi:hypothetical protein
MHCLPDGEWAFSALVHQVHVSDGTGPGNQGLSQQHGLRWTCKSPRESLLDLGGGIVNDTRS